MENLGFEKVYITVACTVTNVILLRNDCFDENQHQNLPVEYLLDYEGMRQNNDHLYKIIYFYISRRFMSFLKIRKEKYKIPNRKIKDELNKSGLYL